MTEQEKSFLIFFSYFNFFVELTLNIFVLYYTKKGDNDTTRLPTITQHSLKTDTTLDYDDAQSPDNVELTRDVEGNVRPTQRLDTNNDYWEDLNRMRQIFNEKSDISSVRTFSSNGMIVPIVVRPRSYRPPTNSVFSNVTIS